MEERKYIPMGRDNISIGKKRAFRIKQKFDNSQARKQYALSIRNSHPIFLDNVRRMTELFIEHNNMFKAMAAFKRERFVSHDYCLEVAKQVSKEFTIAGKPSEMLRQSIEDREAMRKVAYKIMEDDSDIYPLLDLVNSTDKIFAIAKLAEELQKGRGVEVNVNIDNRKVEIGKHRMGEYLGRLSDDKKKILGEMLQERYTGEITGKPVAIMQNVTKVVTDEDLQKRVDGEGIIEN